MKFKKSMKFTNKKRTICEVVRECNDLLKDLDCSLDGHNIFEQKLKEIHGMAKNMTKKLYQYNKEWDKEFWEKNKDYEKDLLRNIDE